MKDLNLQKMRYKLRSIISALGLIACLSSCIPYNSIVNYNESAGQYAQPKAITNYKPLKVEPHDVLQIEVSSIEAEAVEIFRNYRPNGYMVSTDGNIDYPLIGQFKVEGLTLEEVKIQLQSGLAKYFVKQPTINLRIANFRILVNGEVNTPGSFTVNSGKVSVVEAITLAGDFTQFARRDSVMVIREVDNKRTISHVDFNSGDLFESPYFYLKQNDVVYVKPTKDKLGAIRNREAKLLPVVSIALSVVLIAATFLNLR